MDMVRVCESKFVLTSFKERFGGIGYYVSQFLQATTSSRSDCMQGKATTTVLPEHKHSSSGFRSPLPPAPPLPDLILTRPSVVMSFMEYNSNFIADCPVHVLHFVVQT
jgi:hypothetical protein